MAAVRDATEYAGQPGATVDRLRLVGGVREGLRCRRPLDRVGEGTAVVSYGYGALPIPQIDLEEYFPRVYIETKHRREGLFMSEFHGSGDN